MHRLGFVVHNALEASKLFCILHVSLFLAVIKNHNIMTFVKGCA